MHEFCMGDQFGPGCGVVAAEDAKIGFNFLVDLFGLAIELWVISGGKG